MQRAARQDVLADERLRRTIREARVLNDEAVGQWLVSKRIGNACHTFAPDQGESALQLAEKYPGSKLGEALLPRPYPGDGLDGYIAAEKFREVFAADLPAATTS